MPKPDNVSFDDGDVWIRAEPKDESVTIVLTEIPDCELILTVNLTIWQARKLAHALCEFSDTVERKLKNINTAKLD